MKRILCIVAILFLCAVVGYAQQTENERGTAKHKHVLVGCSFWTYDDANSRWLFHNGAMADHDTLWVTVPASASLDTLDAGYYPAIILIPEE